MRRHSADTAGLGTPEVAALGWAIDLLGCYPPIAGRPGRPRHRFEVLLAGK